MRQHGIRLWPTVADPRPAGLHPARRVLHGWAAAAALLAAPPAASQFTTVIDLPGPSGSSIPDNDIIDNDTQVNVRAGGSIGFDVTTQFPAVNTEINVFDSGIVGDFFDAFPGSTVNVYGGSIGSRFSPSGTANIFGGTIGDAFRTSPTSVVNLVGPSFSVSGGGPGVGVGETAVVTQRGGAILSGTLNDGSAIDFQLNDTFVSAAQDIINPNATLRVIGAPDPAGFSNLIYSPITDVSGLAGIGSDTQLNLYPGDSLPANFAAGETFGGSNTQVNIYHGTAVGDGFQARSGTTVNLVGDPSPGILASLGSNVYAESGTTINVLPFGWVGFNSTSFGTVNVDGGFVMPDFTIDRSGTLNVSDGLLGDDARATGSSTVNISGGLVGNGFRATQSSTVNVSVGSVGNDFRATENGTVNISGGEWLFGGRDFRAEDTSTLNLIGRDFDLDGSPLVGIGQVAVVPNRGGETLGGTLVDLRSIAFELNDSALPVPAGESAFADTATVRVIGAPSAAGFDEAIYSPVTDVSGLAGVGSDTQLNLYEGDSLPANFAAGEVFGGSNTQVNVYGGAVGDDFLARPGSVINISGGDFGDRFTAEAGSVVNLVGRKFGVSPGRFVPPASIGGVGQVTLVEDRGAFETLAGTLADGSAIVFDINAEPQAGRGAFDPNATLRVIGVPDATGFTTVINGPVTDLSALVNIGSHTQLNLFEGDTLIPGFFAGEGGDNGGNTELNVFGGSVGTNLVVPSGTTVNVSGGSVGENAFSAGTVNVSGGDLGGGFQAGNTSTVNLIGSSFDLDGAPVVEIGETAVIPNRGGETLGGTLLDGSPIDFELNSNFAATATVRVIGAPSAAGFDKAIYSPITDVSALTSIGSDTQLNLYEGGSLPADFSFDGLNAEFNIFGGSVGDNAVLSTNVNSVIGVTLELNVFGGSIGDNLRVLLGELNITGGSIGDDFSAGGDVYMAGGTIGDRFTLSRGDTLDISGGTVGEDFRAFGENTVNITGGRFGDGFRAEAFTTINLFGSEFVFSELDGSNPTPITDFTTPFTMRDVILSGILEDESEFSFVLNSVFDSQVVEDFFSPDATINLIPTPGTGGTTLVEGDYSGDGFVSQPDLDLVLLNWGDTVLPDGFAEGAVPGGGSFDGLIGQNELDGILLNWGDGTLPGVTAVPEPATGVLLALSGLACRRRQGRASSFCSHPARRKND
ncbi:MAG: hypothetical protein AAF333_05265 [Planctomycetota bacterium]